MDQDQDYDMDEDFEEELDESVEELSVNTPVPPPSSSARQTLPPPHPPLPPSSKGRPQSPSPVPSQSQRSNSYSMSFDEGLASSSAGSGGSHHQAALPPPSNTLHLSSTPSYTSDFDDHTGSHSTSPPHKHQPSRQGNKPAASVELPSPSDYSISGPSITHHSHPPPNHHYHHQHPRLTNIPLEIFDMREAIKRLCGQGGDGARDVKLLEGHLVALEDGLEEVRRRHMELERRHRAAAREKKERAEMRRLQHIESLAEVNRKLASAQYDMKQSQSQAEELRRTLDMTENEVEYVRESLEATERAKKAAEDLAHMREGEMEELREKLEKEGKEKDEEITGLEQEIRRVLVEKDVAEKLVEVERVKLQEEGKAQLRRVEEQYQTKLEEAKAERHRSQVEASVLKASHERLERRIEEEKANMPEHYRRMLEVEEERLRKLEKSLVQERESLDSDREKFLTEMHAWRKRMEEDEKDARRRATTQLEQAKEEVDAYRKSFEEDKARIKQDLLVVEMKVEKEKASLEREKERQEKEQKRLSEENALLAVRAGLLGPQFQEIDKAYKDLESREEEVNKKLKKLEEDEAQLGAHMDSIIKREKAIQENLKDVSVAKEEVMMDRQDKRRLDRARVRLHEQYLQLARQSQEVRRGVSLVRQLVNLLPSPDDTLAAADWIEPQDYYGLMDAVSRCLDDASAAIKPLHRELLADLNNDLLVDDDDDDDEEEEMVVETLIPGEGGRSPGRDEQEGGEEKRLTNRTMEGLSSPSKRYSHTLAAYKRRKREDWPSLAHVPGPDLASLMASLGLSGSLQDDSTTTQSLPTRLTWRAVINGEEDDLSRLGYRQATESLNGTVEAIKTAMFQSGSDGRVRRFSNLFT